MFLLSGKRPRRRSARSSGNRATMEISPRPARTAARFRPISTSLGTLRSRCRPRSWLWRSGETRSTHRRVPLSVLTHRGHGRSHFEGSMMDTYVVVDHDNRFWTGSDWSREYPDAEVFDSFTAADLSARKA